MEPVLLASGWRLREQDSKGAKPADLPIQKPVLDIRPPGSTVRVAAFPVARRRRAPPPRRRQVVNALNGLQCSLPARRYAPKNRLGRNEAPISMISWRW